MKPDFWAISEPFLSPGILMQNALAMIGALKTLIGLALQSFA